MTGFFFRTFGSHKARYHPPGFHRSAPLRIGSVAVGYAARALARYLVIHPAERSGGSGDWKQSSKGADKYLLVTAGRQPYWADAIGQIPFAVNSAADSLKMSGDPDRAITNTVNEGQVHSEGQLVGGTPEGGRLPPYIWPLLSALPSNFNDSGGMKTRAPTLENRNGGQF